MSRPSKPTVRRLYKQALLAVFGTGDKDMDKHLVASLKNDIHLGGSAPGGWCPHAALEIYCESGIPNATHINEFPPMPEFGVQGGCSYNADHWAKVDALVNSGLNALGYQGVTVYHEPYNNAVVAVAWV